MTAGCSSLHYEPMPRFMLVSDVARALGLSPTSIRLLAAQGRLPVAATTIAGVRLFDPRRVERLAQERAASRADTVERTA